MPTVPSLLAVLICDTIIIDSQSQKKSLIGIFERIHASEVPFTQQLGFYARLTDAEGEYTFTIRMIHLGDQEKLVAAVQTVPVVQKDRLGIVDLALNMPPMPFPDFGRYEFQLFCNDIYIGRALISAVKAQGA